MNIKNNKMNIIFLIIFAIILSILWLFFGATLLSKTNIHDPVNIKQFVFQSLITGPLGFVLMSVHLGSPILKEKIGKLCYKTIIKISKINNQLE
jgi:hypothetical protein